MEKLKKNQKQLKGKDFQEDVQLSSITPNFQDKSNMPQNTALKRTINIR